MGNIFLLQLDPLLILSIQYGFLAVTGSVYMTFTKHYRIGRKLFLPFGIMRVAFILYFVTLFYGYR